MTTYIFLNIYYYFFKIEINLKNRFIKCNNNNNNLNYCHYLLGIFGFLNNIDMYIQFIYNRGNIFSFYG